MDQAPFGSDNPPRPPDVIFVTTSYHLDIIIHLSPFFSHCSTICNCLLSVSLVICPRFAGMRIVLYNVQSLVRTGRVEDVLLRCNVRFGLAVRLSCIHSLMSPAALRLLCVVGGGG